MASLEKECGPTFSISDSLVLLNLHLAAEWAILQDNNLSINKK